MVSGELKLDELILQVFEEHEDTFFWPIDSQKEAKSFIKFLHEKGFLYEDLCKEIGEFDHNFSAWRKGLGRVGIGTRMIKRLNRPVEEVIESDEEEDAEHNLKILAKVNDKNQGKGTKAKTKETVKPAEHKDPKQQKQDIESSMMKNIDKVKTEIINENNQHSKTADTNKVDNKKHDAVVAKKEPVVKVEPPKQEEPKKISPVVVKEEKTKVVKAPETVVVKTLKTEKQQHNQQEARKSTEIKQQEKEVVRNQVVEEKTDSKNEEEKVQDPEVDEVKRKMDAIRKKVELMKKAKAEAAAAAVNQANDASNSAPQGSEAGNKYDAMKKRLGELRSKLMEDESQSLTTEAKDEYEEHSNQEEITNVQQDKVVEQQNVEQPVQSAPIVNVEDEFDDDNSSGNSTESSDLEDDDGDNEGNLGYYDSDLDPDNYDSNQGLHREVKQLVLSIAATRSKTKSYKNGAGHIYIFSDSSPNERQHRVKIGCSKCPEKKYQEARKYNIALKMVSTTPVDKRNSALRKVFESLKSYKIDSEQDWFKGPIDIILQKISSVTEKYGTGPALVSFDSHC